MKWAREVRDQCLASEVSFFFKQIGGLTPKSGGRLLDGLEWNEYPERLSASSLSEPDEASNLALASV